MAKAWKMQLEYVKHVRKRRNSLVKNVIPFIVVELAKYLTGLSISSNVKLFRMYSIVSFVC